jgi:hypothetical protein
MIRKIRSKKALYKRANAEEEEEEHDHPCPENILFFFMGQNCRGNQMLPKI